MAQVIVPLQTVGSGRYSMSILREPGALPALRTPSEDKDPRAPGPAKSRRASRCSVRPSARSEEQLAEISFFRRDERRVALRTHRGSTANAGLGPLRFAPRAGESAHRPSRRTNASRAPGPAFRPRGGTPSRLRVPGRCYSRRKSRTGIETGTPSPPARLSSERVFEGVVLPASLTSSSAICVVERSFLRSFADGRLSHPRSMRDQLPAGHLEPDTRQDLTRAAAKAEIAHLENGAAHAGSAFQRRSSRRAHAASGNDIAR